MGLPDAEFVPAGLPRYLPLLFFTGTSSTSTLVPSLYPVALNGRPLMIDDTDEAGWSHKGIALLRQQADQSSQPSERTLNPEGLWRRSQESWHRGAGQDYLDADDSDDFRFRSSKGIDPWTFQTMELLPATDQKKSGASTNYRLCVAGARLYLADGTHLYYTANVTVDSPTWSDVTGYTGGAIKSLCSDGYTVYITDGADVWTTNTAATTAATNQNTVNVDVLGFVKGRLMGATTGLLYNITAIATPPAALLTLGLNTQFTWVGFAEGTGFIYAAGYTGDKSLIYRTAVKADGTALDAPTVAGELPDGEVIASIEGYLGFILIGTNDGIRFCEADTNGNLNVGPLINLGVTVRDFEGQGNFVWFGWENYDSSSTGLGRLDLRQFTESIETGGRAPAYASDLMVTAQGSVLSVVTFQDIRVFTVSGSGVWAQDTLKVASGTIDSGILTYGLPDPKNAVTLDVRTNPLAGSYVVWLAKDNGEWVQVGSEDDTNDTGTEFPVSTGEAFTFEVRLVLTRDASITTTGPVVDRWTMKVAPGASDGPAEYIFASFLLSETVELPSGPIVAFNVLAEREAIKALRESREIVTYQEAETTYQVQVENFEWHPMGLNYSARTGSFVTPNGVMLTQMKRIE